jgi:hypothetical protein
MQICPSWTGEPLSRGSVSLVRRQVLYQFVAPTCAPHHANQLGRPPQDPHTCSFFLSQHSSNHKRKGAQPNRPFGLCSGYYYNNLSYFCQAPRCWSSIDGPHPEYACAPWKIKSAAQLESPPREEFLQLINYLISQFMCREDALWNIVTTVGHGNALDSRKSCATDMLLNRACPGASRSTHDFPFLTQPEERCPTTVA